MIRHSLSTQCSEGKAKQIKVRFEHTTTNLLEHKQNYFYLPYDSFWPFFFIFLNLNNELEENHFLVLKHFFCLLHIIKGKIVQLKKKYNFSTIMEYTFVHLGLSKSIRIVLERRVTCGKGRWRDRRYHIRLIKRTVQVQVGKFF